MKLALGLHVKNALSRWMLRSENAEYLVRVKAQVMTRDDSTGGWVPMGGGGVSIVGLRKRVHPSAPPEDLRHEYLINGQRMSDNSVVLNCALKKDVQYTKANPTFHHWKTEEKRFGLTFQTHADARAFDKGVKRAVEDLLEGTIDPNSHHAGDDDVFMTLDLPIGRKDSSSLSASTASTTTSSPTAQSPSLSPTLAPSHDAFSSAGLVGGTPGSAALNNHHNQHLHRVHYIKRLSSSNAQQQQQGKLQLAQTPPAPLPLTSSPTPPSNETVTTKSSSVDSNGRSVDDLWVKSGGDPRLSGVGGVGGSHHHLDVVPVAGEDRVDMGTDYSYVEFARQQPSAGHEYSYPTLDSVTGGNGGSGGLGSSQHRRDSIGEIKKLHHWGSSHNRSSSHGREVLTSQPPLPTKKKKRDRIKKGDKKQSLLGKRARCAYCHETFQHENNVRGSCEDAPDRAMQCIERVSCICCAQSMLYHCMADQDGQYTHTCSCDSDSENCKKWTALTLLACIVPCLWCYWPLVACHRCGTACGCCGARHKAA